MLVRQQALPAGEIKHTLKKRRRHIAAQPPVTIFREHRHVPDAVVHAEAHEPAQQQIVERLPGDGDRASEVGRKHLLPQLARM